MRSFAESHLPRVQNDVGPWGELGILISGDDVHHVDRPDVEQLIIVRALGGHPDFGETLLVQVVHQWEVLWLLALPEDPPYLTNLQQLCLKVLLPEHVVVQELLERKLRRQVLHLAQVLIVLVGHDIRRLPLANLHHLYWLFLS